MTISNAPKNAANKSVLTTACNGNLLPCLNNSLAAVLKLDTKSAATVIRCPPSHPPTVYHCEGSGFGGGLNRLHLLRCRVTLMNDLFNNTTRRKRLKRCNFMALWKLLRKLLLPYYCWTESSKHTKVYVHCFPLPLVLGHCWLDDWKRIRPSRVVVCWWW